MKIIAPASAVITTAELKAHLRVDHSAEDAVIDGCLLDAMKYAQRYTGVAVGQQTIEHALDAFPGGAMLTLLELRKRFHLLSTT
jgi:uncharacterized phiE125 gp8 family phage protein